MRVPGGSRAGAVGVSRPHLGEVQAQWGLRAIQGAACWEATSPGPPFEPPEEPQLRPVAYSSALLRPLSMGSGPFRGAARGVGKDPLGHLVCVQTILRPVRAGNGRG